MKFSKHLSTDMPNWLCSSGEGRKVNILAPLKSFSTYWRYTNKIIKLIIIIICVGI